MRRRIYTAIRVATAMLLLAYASDGVVLASRLPDPYPVSPRQMLAIVVNRSNPVDNLSLSELRRVFLGERAHWPNGHRIAVAMINRGPERDAVLRLVYRMKESDYREHFLKAMFDEEVFVSPKTLDSPVVMRRFVFNAPGAIGYLRSADVDSSVKVLHIGGLLPDDGDYPLQIDQPAERK